MAKVTVLKTVETSNENDSDSFELTPESVNPSGVGGRLRAARLNSGQTLAQISNVLKIRQTHLMAIEKEDFSELPGGAYTVGFIRSYAEAVGENGEEIVAILKERQEVTTDVELPVYERIETDVLPSKSTMLTGIVLLAVLIGAWVAYDAGIFEYKGEASTEVTPEPQVSREVVDVPAQKKIELQKVAEEIELQEAETAKQPVESVNDILAAMKNNAVATEEEAQLDTAENLPVTLIAQEDVWLSIYNEQTPDNPILNTVLKKGKTYNVPTEKGLRANIGRPHVLTMNIGEQEYPATGPEWGGVIKNIPLDPHYLVHTFYGQKVNEESYGRWVKKNQ